MEMDVFKTGKRNAVYGKKNLLVSQRVRVETRNELQEFVNKTQLQYIIACEM